MAKLYGSALIFSFQKLFLLTILIVSCVCKHTEYCISWPAHYFDSHLLLCESFLPIVILSTQHFLPCLSSTEDCASSPPFISSSTRRKVAITIREKWLLFIPSVPGHWEMFLPHRSNTAERHQDSVLLPFLGVTLPLLFQLLKQFDGSVHEMKIQRKKEAHLNDCLQIYFVS